MSDKRKHLATRVGNPGESIGFYLAENGESVTIFADGLFDSTSVTISLIEFEQMLVELKEGLKT